MLEDGAPSKSLCDNPQFARHSEESTTLNGGRRGILHWLENTPHSAGRSMSGNWRLGYCPQMMVKQEEKW